MDRKLPRQPWRMKSVPLRGCNPHFFTVNLEDGWYGVKCENGWWLLDPIDSAWELWKWRIFKVYGPGILLGRFW